MDRPQLASLALAIQPEDSGFPFEVPAVASLRRLEFPEPVTLLVGENGTGKSTVLEALAVAASLPSAGAGSLEQDSTLSAQRRLAQRMRLTWRGRSHRGFFLRAEDFFGFQKALVQAQEEHRREIGRIRLEMADAPPLARTLAEGPHHASLGEIARRYGENPDGSSHGEAFLRFFGSRLTPRGLFLLDEPEAALSPQSQLAFIEMVRAGVEEGGQFIIATHAPILMAIPGALILSFDRSPVKPVSFDELPSVSLMRDFLKNPQRYLRHLWPTE